MNYGRYSGANLQNINNPISLTSDSPEVISTSSVADKQDKNIANSYDREEEVKADLK